MFNICSLLETLSSLPKSQEIPLPNFTVATSWCDSIWHLVPPWSPHSPSAGHVSISSQLAVCVCVCVYLYVFYIMSILLQYCVDMRTTYVH